ncbi:hypothetical protein GIB67_004338 [Kingdonia uniflora]|uniref:Rhamnogalacturonase A/B/Epimerase-like pectate lyase domain-containing protein n=1 Tax=Kingdonia uniflora TaxID=39325 RepID=A0A7J7MRK4_9MAGN|nr:hypothetical protein GIB67_004338 [Kingdonia uniflora]
MAGFSVKGFIFILLIAILVWSSSIENCNARRGSHWRQSRADSASLTKKKGRNHGSSNGHHQGRSRGDGAKQKSRSPPGKGYNGPKKKSPMPSKKGYNGGKPTLFNVLHFGAKGDGTTDDTKAFQAAWASACKMEGSTVIVPSNFEFLVGPISFSGPYCQPNIIFQLDGTIIAPTSFKAWGSGLFQWLEFTKLKGITVQDVNVFPGHNPVFDLSHWQISSELREKMPSIKPTALRFYGSYNVTVTGITIINSPQCHLKFDNCVSVKVFDMTVLSPGDSLNTDGIHLQNSQDVLIYGTNIACGHGISIGGLGRDNTKACVSNITVRDVVMHNTMNGVRIKTWQGGSGSVQGVLFSNILVSEVELPIVIDQFYCDKRLCKNQTSAVALSGINYEQIRGTYTVKSVHFACSDSLPCEDVSLTSIQLKPLQERYHLYEPFCWQTFGELSTPTIPPIDCLQIGKPLTNRIQSDYDSC